MSFENTGLMPALHRAAQNQGLVQATAIQQAAIPTILAGRDVLMHAPTGSGKTVAYVLPVLHRLHTAVTPPGRVRSVRALILLPTRELAQQVGDVIRAYTEPLQPRLKLVTVFGGVSINPQMMRLRGGADVLVATPGRLLDLMAHNAAQLNQVATLVLDEADRLLDAGFADEVARVLDALPRQRQTVLVSATWPAVAQDWARSWAPDAQRVDNTSSAEPTTAPDENRAIHAGPPLRSAESTAIIQQHAVWVDAGRRLQLLNHLIHQNAWTRVLVFVATRYSAVHVADKLCRLGVQARSLHGDLSQGARQRVLADFKSGSLQVLVTTDVAARGIDIAQLPAMVNFDLPRSASDHVHRIGRTGRAGLSGEAWSFIIADEPGVEAHFRLIEKRQGQRVAREQIPGFEPQQAPLVTRPTPGTSGDTLGGIKGRRPSKKDKLRAQQPGRPEV